MDYFKKTPPATKVTSPPQQSKENEFQHMEAGTDPAAKRGKPPSKKSVRKVGRPAKKALAMNPPEADEDVILVESTTQLEDQPRDANMPVEAPENKGNTTSIAQSIGETAEDVKEVNESNCADNATPTSKKDIILKDISDGVPSVKADPEQDGAVLFVSFTPEEKGRRGRAGRKNGKGRKADSAQSDVPEAQECSEQQLQAPSSLGDAGLEEEAKDESQLNLSTVRVSFEDFLKSHSPKGIKQQQQEDEKKEEEVEEVKAEMEAGEMRPALTSADQATDRLSVSKPSDEGVQPPSTQVSPRTLTVQAEIHPISPDQDLSRASDRKVASIFTACRRSKEKPASSPQPQASSETPPAPLRKSNVVLQEEDLELAVLEAGSSSSSAASVPKCSQAERKQFMNAFKQPDLDTSKGKASKAAGKLKQQQPAEKDASADGEKEKGEELNEEEGKARAKQKRSEVEIEEGDPKTLDGVQKAARKRKRGRPKKEQTTNPEEPTPPAALPAKAEAEESATAEAPAAACEAPTAKEAEKAQPGEVQPISTPTAIETRRRSARELTRKQSTPASLTPSSQSQSKHTDSTSTSTSLELPSPVGTPRTHHPKQRMYKSHMVAPPDDKGSPIR